MRVKKYDRLKIAQQMKHLGVSAKELTDEEYTILDKMVRKVKDYSKPVKFDETSDIIFGKLPEAAKSKEVVMKDGSSKWSIPLIMENGQWTNFLTTQEEADLSEGHMGEYIAVVGKIKENKVADKTFFNINGYRGSIIIELQVDDADDNEIDI